jgi:DeoR/GlpR family transcriptional regulator of sugar metabolism
MQTDRRRMIVELVQAGGSKRVAQLCNLLGVSEMTIRRDLRDLEREGFLRRVHGGAVVNLGRSFEPPYAMRTTSHQARKQAIGRRAAELVLEGDSIALDVGTTTLELAQALHDKRNLTILTASLPIANQIVSRLSLTADVRLILTGGIVRAGELSMIGPIPARTYCEYHVDKAFVGVGGMSLEAGLTEYNVDDAAVKQALIQNARQRIVLADSSKIGRATFAAVAPLSVVDTLVTDDGLPDEQRRALEAAGIEVVTVAGSE